MSYLIEETEHGQKAFESFLIEPKNLNVFNSELSLKILKELGKNPGCAMDIARNLKQHEQKIYYHMRRLEKAGIIKMIKREERVGAFAKIYSVVSPVIAVKLFDSIFTLDTKTRAKEIEFFTNFINNGKINFTIIVGSPDPHGKYGVQASDGIGAIDLALFLGSFVKNVSPNYKLDTHVREIDLKNNLILIGGPKANIIVEKINKHLPIYFNTKDDWSIFSTLSKITYTDEDIGIITKIKNPFSKEKEIILLSGKRFKGTRAAILALMKKVSEVKKGNKYDSGEIAKVVRGIDRDSDGRIDDVEFLE